MDIKIFAITFLITTYITNIICSWFSYLELKEKILYSVSMIIILFISLFLILKVV